LLDLHGTDIQLINTEFEMKLLGKDGGAKKTKKINQSINQSISQSIEEAAPPPEHWFSMPMQHSLRNCCLCEQFLSSHDRPSAHSRGSSVGELSSWCSR